MLSEFRYHAITSDRRSVQGIIYAKNKRDAQKNVDIIAIKHNLVIKSIIKKRLFLFKVKLDSGKKISGRQYAFDKSEVSNALKKMGYKNIFIEPALMDIKSKPPYATVLMFINLSTFLLNEKMTYDKILRMLADDEPNLAMREALKKIESELKKGKEGTEVFARYQDIFGKFPAYMLGLATKSGNMAEVHQATAKFMERDMEYKKSLKKALLSPAMTVLFMLIAVGYYIGVIFPKTAGLFESFNIELPVMTAATLKLSNFIGASWWIIGLLIVTPVIMLTSYWRTPQGRIKRDKFIITLPLIGHLLHKSSIEIFFRVFAAIYSGSENNIETLTASAEACRNSFIEHGIKQVTIPLMLKEGMGLIPALIKADVFNRSTINRLKSGTEAGNILSSAKQISAFYEKETTYKMEVLIDSVQSIIGAFIAIVITLLTIVSSEIALVSPDTTAM